MLLRNPELVVCCSRVHWRGERWTIDDISYTPWEISAIMSGIELVPRYNGTRPRDIFRERAEWSRCPTSEGGDFILNAMAS
jgi:hypothetical protein